VLDADGLGAARRRHRRIAQRRSITALPEGCQQQLRLAEPEGLLQGHTSRGSPGDFGPRLPTGDPPHHYHFQVFALDTLLEAPLGGEEKGTKSCRPCKGM